MIGECSHPATPQAGVGSRSRTAERTKREYALWYLIDFRLGGVTWGHLDEFENPHPRVSESTGGRRLV